MTEKVTIYHDVKFNGTSREVTEDISNLTSIGFNNRVSSIKVVGSVWVGYEDFNYNGRQYILEEGEYPKWDAWEGSNDQLSSLKKLHPDIGDSPQIVLYQLDKYGGDAVSFTYGIDSLKYYDFNNKASSLKVKSGIWILYQFPNYGGRQYVVTEGSYPRWSDWGGANNQISSLRPIKEPFVPTEVLSMTFDISAGFNSAPVVLDNRTYKNDSSSVLTATWVAKRTFTTTETHSWHWENKTAIKVGTTFKTGVPFIADGEIELSAENTFSIGENEDQKNTQSKEWTVSLPVKIEKRSMMHVQIIIQRAKIDVPFTAILKQGKRRWKEVGTYTGVQSFNVVTDVKETPL